MNSVGRVLYLRSVRKPTEKAPERGHPPCEFACQHDPLAHAAWTARNEALLAFGKVTQLLAEGDNAGAAVASDAAALAYAGLAGHLRNLERSRQK